MTVTVKNKTPLIVPPSVRRRAGRRGDDEYTHAQRRAILADAKAGVKEIEQGKGYGPFETGAELRALVERAINKGETRKPKRKAK